LRSCQPPDPAPRQPDYRLPAGACDAHCHVFGPAARFPYAPERRYTPPDAPREHLAQLHATLGIERAVIVQASCHGTDNSAMLDAIAHSNGRYRGVCNARGAFSDAEFERLHEGGIRGVRFNFVKHLGGTPDLDRLRDIVARVAPLGWHTEWHFDAADVLQFEGLFEQMPLPIVLDHMGRVPVADGLEQGPFRTLKQLFARNERLWIKISGAERISRSGPPFHDAVPFAQALVDIAPERLVWGTDWPHPNISGTMPNDGDLVDLLPLIMDDEAVRRQVLVDNPARLFGFN
jgi:predicted TIM-barrel fold metal-dependent hydrolase